MKRTTQFKQQSFLIVVNSRYLAGFRFLKHGLDIGMTDDEGEALIFPSVNDAKFVLDYLKLSGRIQSVKPSTNKS